MRPLALHLILLALIAPLAAVASTEPAGALDIEAANGVITIKGKGGLLGRVAEGSVLLVDLSPNDQWRWWLNGTEHERRTSAKGSNLSFRILGGDYRITVRGQNISISAHGKGTATLQGLPGPTGSTGGYTTDLNADCQTTPASCAPLSTSRTRVNFGPQPPTSP